MSILNKARAPLMSGSAGFTEVFMYVDKLLEKSPHGETMKKNLMLADEKGQSCMSPQI